MIAVRRELDETSSREAGERCFDVEPVTEYRAQEGRVTRAPGDREHVKDAALGDGRLVGPAEQQDRQPLGQVAQPTHIRERSRAVALDDETRLGDPTRRFLEIRGISRAPRDQVVDRRGRQRALSSGVSPIWR